MTAYGSCLRLLLAASMALPTRKWAAQRNAVAATQQERLLAILGQSAQTTFGREHRFAELRTPDDYRARVPIAGYDAFQPSIRRMMDGAPDVLAAGRAGMFSVTSGTSGEPKHIPVTRAFTLEQHMPHRLWMNALTCDHPFVADHFFLTIVSPAEEGRTAGGIPYGSMSGKSYRDQAIPVRRRHAVPYEAMAIRQHDSKYFALLAFAMGRPVSCVTAVNPSTLHLLGMRMGEWSECLLVALERQVRDGHGGFSDLEGLSSKERATLERLLRPEPARVRRLREVFRSDGIILPRTAWPEPKALCTWHGGNASFYLERLEPLWGPHPTRCLGLRASEGVFSIPVADCTAEGLLAIGAHFLEFLPEDETPAPHSRTLLAHELEAGKRYRLIITTSAGLYRYDLADIVEVTSVDRHGLPSVAFRHRAGNVLSLTGEKVTETQAVAAVRALSGTVRLDGFTVTARLDMPPRYILAVETGDTALCAEGGAARLAEAFDRELSAANCEYASKRESHRLALPEVILLPGGAYAAWRRRKTEAGVPDGQIKPPHFARDASFLEQLLRGT